MSLTANFFLTVVGLVAVVGTVALRNKRWRTAALLMAALSLSSAILEVAAHTLLGREAHGSGVVSWFEPSDWLMKDSELGYRPRPNTLVSAASHYDGKSLYNVIYSIESDGSRWTPPAEPAADTYLFIGDSFMFGQGLRDLETVPSRLAETSKRKVKTLLFAAPGYGPNHFLRMLETSKATSIYPSKIKAVVTWIIPAHLSRVTGDETWLGGSPRYTIEDGDPRFSGSFDEYRRSHPSLAIGHWLTGNFAFLSAIGQKQREELQARTFSALMLHMQKLVHEKYNAPLIVLYSWPDQSSPINYAGLGEAQPRLVSILEDLRRNGLNLVEVNSLGYGLPNDQILIPHDGHPTALVDSLIAERLRRHLFGSEPSNK